MRSEVITITPEMAKEWMERNIDHNRNINRKRVEQYATDMKSGNWQLNCEPICFNESGKLVDGQHRLMAVIKADRAVTMMVVSGVADDVTIYNTGLPRRTENMLQMAGVGATKKHTSAARTLLELVTSNVTTGQINRFVTENLNTLNRAVGLSARRSNNQKILERANIAAAAWVIICNGYERETIERFFDVAASGFYNDASETAAVAFRNYILSLSTAHGGSYRELRRSEFYCCLKAFADFCSGKPRKRSYDIEKIKETDIFRGSNAEAILERYVKPESAPAPGPKEAVPQKPANEPKSTLNWKDQEAGEILRSARKGAG